MPELSERRLANLLKTIIEQCAKVPRSRPTLDDPALSLCLADLIRLTHLLADAAEISRQHKLDTARLLEYRDAVSEEISVVILPIMARIEGIEVARQRYGPFHLESDDKRDAFRWNGLIGTVAGIRQHAESLLRAIEANAKQTSRNERNTSEANEQSDEKGMLSLEDAARFLGYSPSGLRKIVRRTRQGKAQPAIQFSQVGTGPLRFKREWLDEFIAANSVMPQREIPTPIPTKAAHKSRSIASNDPGTLADYFP